MTNKYSSHIPTLSLILVAIIWGSTFSLQKRAMLYLDTFQFIGVRFALASLLLFLVLYKSKNVIQSSKHTKILLQKDIQWQGLFLGLLLFIGQALQQIGVQHTTAVNSAFITSLYVILVPLILFFFTPKQDVKLWLPALSATVGLFLLSGGTPNKINYLGDSIQLIASFIWALHIIFCGKFASNKKLPDIIAICFIQSLICSVLAIITSFILGESWHFDSFKNVWWDLAITGIVSAGLANLIQIAAQGKTQDKHAAIILSLEGVFSTLAAWIILDELLSFISIIGASIIVASVIASQMLIIKQKS